MTVVLIKTLLVCQHVSLAVVVVTTLQRVLLCALLVRQVSSTTSQECQCVRTATLVPSVENLVLPHVHHVSMVLKPPHKEPLNVALVLLDLTLLLMDRLSVLHVYLVLISLCQELLLVSLVTWVSLARDRLLPSALCAHWAQLLM